MVVAVVTGLRHRHLKVVGIRLLLVFVRITVGGDRFCSLTRLDGIGQILDGGLQLLVPVSQPVHRILHLFRVASVPVDGAAQTEQCLHCTAYRLDTTGNNAQRFGQVDAFQAVQRLPQTFQVFTHPFRRIDTELFHQSQQVFCRSHVFLHLPHAAVQGVRCLRQCPLLRVSGGIQCGPGVLLLGFSPFFHGLVIGFLGLLDG